MKKRGLPPDVIIDELDFVRLKIFEDGFNGADTLRREEAVDAMDHLLNDAVGAGCATCQQDAWLAGGCGKERPLLLNGCGCSAGKIVWKYVVTNRL